MSERQVLAKQKPIEGNQRKILSALSKRGSGR